MAAETVSKRGRPVGTRTATVELDTLSFKVPAEFKARLQAYAKQRRHSISELIREGVEWRIGEGDPLNIRYGTLASGETAHEGNTGNTQGVEVGVEFLHDMLSALADEVRQLRNAVQALEQRIEDTRSLHAPSVTGNTGITSADGDIPVVGMEVQLMLKQTLARVIPEFDPARFRLGKLCKRGHAYHGTAQTLYRLPRFVCPECDAEGARERRKAKREAQPVAG